MLNGARPALTSAYSYGRVYHTRMGAHKEVLYDVGGAHPVAGESREYTEIPAICGNQPIRALFQ